MKVDEAGAGPPAQGTPPAAIRIAALTLSYRSPIMLRRKPVLRGLDLEVHTGEVFGFLGLNGAGKTTTIRCLVGLIRPDQGELAVLGGTPAAREVRARLGYLPESPALPDYLTPIEVLELMGRLTGLRRPRRRGADRRAPHRAPARARGADSAPQALEGHRAASGDRAGGAP